MLHDPDSCQSPQGCRVRPPGRTSAVKFCAAVFAIAASIAFTQSPAPGPGQPVLALQTGHTDSVLFMAISPDGRWVASSSDHGPVKLWSVSSALEVRSFSPDYARDIVDIDFTGDSARLFIRSSDGYLNEEVSLWEVTSGRELRRFRIGTDVRGTALSTDATQLAVARRVGVELWNVANNRRIRTLGRSAADAVAFTPDGRALAIGEPGGLTLWETASGSQLATLPVALKAIAGGLRAVRTSGRLSVSPDGKWLAYQDDTERVWVWDMVPHSQPRLLTRLTWPTVFQFTADSRELAVHESKSGRSTAFDPASGHQIRPFAARPATLVFSETIGSNGTLLAGGGRSSGSTSIAVVELNTGRHMASLQNVVEWMSAVAVSPDDKWLITASRNGSMSVWDTSRGIRRVHLSAHLSAVHALAFHPDGRLFASGGNDVIKVWDVQSGRELRTLQGTGGTLLSRSAKMGSGWLAAAKAAKSSCGKYRAGDNGFN